MPTFRFVPILLILAVLIGNAGAAAAQSAENVAVIVNDNSAASQRIGEYYARRRALPVSNIIHIKTTVEDNIDRGVYAATIEAPIASALAQQGLQDRILYVVLTKGVPLRIVGTVGPQGTVASVDSELTQVYRHSFGRATAAAGKLPNPYYLADRPVTDAKPFSHREHDFYLVTRLDAFSVEDVIALIDRGMTPVREGRIVLDQQDKLINRQGEDWLADAAKQVERAGQGERVLLETTVTGARDVKPVLGYYSWGSNDPRNRVRKFGMGFVPGAIAGLFVSTDARTFREPPADWLPASGDQEQSKWFGGSPQSLIGDLIREGVTGVSGHVAEPYLEATVRPQILFPTYLAGMNLAEAFYLAMPYLSWQNVVIGDPLCAPFRQRSLTRSDLGDAMDAETQLPALFSARRVTQITPLLPGVSEEGVKLTVRGEHLLARRDVAGARSTFEQAVRQFPQASYTELQLALIYDGDQNIDGAIARYRHVIELQPRNGLALNNLAYSLATNRNSAAEALPLARRAVATAPQNPAFLDTLGWIEHLTGDDQNAAKRMALAVRGAPASADLRLHAAIIYAATGARAVAETELQQALKLQPSLEDSADVKRLRARLAELAAPAQ